MYAHIFENGVVGPIVSDLDPLLKVQQVDIAGLDPQPESGWTYKDGSFSPPDFDVEKTVRIEMLRSAKLDFEKNNLDQVLIDQITAVINSATQSASLQDLARACGLMPKVDFTNGTVTTVPFVPSFD